MSLVFLLYVVMIPFLFCAVVNSLVFFISTVSFWHGLSLCVLDAIQFSFLSLDRLSVFAVAKSYRGAREGPYSDYTGSCISYKSNHKKPTMVLSLSLGWGGRDGRSRL